MRSLSGRLLCLFAVLLSVAIARGAQDSSPAPKGAGRDSADPRVGLKPGLRDAGTAARNMELVASVPKPAGFFDPKSPAGEATPPEDAAKTSTGTTEAPKTSQSPGLSFANSDLAFARADLFVGNFNGFNTYDIESPKGPRLLVSVVCPGG